jgi:hypothetical protein
MAIGWNNELSTVGSAYRNKVPNVVSAREPHWASHQHSRNSETRET